MMVSPLIMHIILGGWQNILHAVWKIKRANATFRQQININFCPRYPVPMNITGTMMHIYRYCRFDCFRLIELMKLHRY